MALAAEDCHVITGGQQRRGLEMNADELQFFNSSPTCEQIRLNDLQIAARK